VRLNHAWGYGRVQGRGFLFKLGVAPLEKSLDLCAHYIICVVNFTGAQTFSTAASLCDSVQFIRAFFPIKYVIRVPVSSKTEMLMPSSQVGCLSVIEARHINSHVCTSFWSPTRRTVNCLGASHLAITRSYLEVQLLLETTSSVLPLTAKQDINLSRWCVCEDAPVNANAYNLPYHLTHPELKTAPFLSTTPNPSLTTPFFVPHSVWVHTLPSKLYFH